MKQMHIILYLSQYILTIIFYHLFLKSLNGGELHVNDIFYKNMLKYVKYQIFIQ